MEIRFSTARQYPEDEIWQVARLAGCHARVKWSTAAAVRFQLVRSKESFEQAEPTTQEKVIAALLNLDPGATIRTARAVYEGKMDYESQLKGRV